MATDATALNKLGSASQVDIKERFSLDGVFQMDGKHYASVHDRQTQRSEWVSQNETVFGYVVKDLSGEKVILSKPGNEPLTLYLVKGSIGVLENSAAPERYSKAWINSKANPMLRTVQPMPIDIYRNWQKLSTAEKSQIIEYYKNHGWRLILAETIGETTNLAWENIYEKERSEVIKANREAFANSLTIEQRTDWGKMSSNQPIMIANGQPTAEQLRMGEERRRAFQNFKSTLSESQKQQFDAIPDFTTGKW